MIGRRELVLWGTAGLLAAALLRGALAAPPADDPAGIVTATYARAAKGMGDARTRKGDVGPVDFDPVTNSQDPDVKSFKVVAEKHEAEKATIAVTIEGHQGPRTKPADQTMRYDFVRDAGQWKIDDIKGSADGRPWSIRGMLAASLKYQGFQRWPAAGDRQAIANALLRMIGEFLIAQAPVLPELKPAQ